MAGNDKSHEEDVLSEGVSQLVKEHTMQSRRFKIHMRQVRTLGNVGTLVCYAAITEVHPFWEAPSEPPNISRRLLGLAIAAVSGALIGMALMWVAVCII